MRNSRKKGAKDLLKNFRRSSWTERAVSPTIFWLEKAGLVFYDSPARSEVTSILHAVKHGEGKTADELLPLVYQELRRLAAHKMANEAAGTLCNPPRSSMRPGCAW